LTAGVFFVLILPLALLMFGGSLDRLLPWRLPALGVWPFVIGIALMVLGGFFALWSIADQLFRAGGSPLPMMATQELLISGPFRFCRNPMSFGTLLLYSGLGILLLSPGIVILVAGLGVLLLTYIKRFEEKELEIRFGEAYKVYKEKTPFIIPGVHRRK
jgi:protein-S-isoprenylcysteine O-methyltransferase Ste14